MQAITQHQVQAFVTEELNLKKFATANRCRDVMCVFEKLMFHKMFRSWNQWQSFLLHRYFRLFQDVESLHFHHLHLKKVGGKWLYSMGEITNKTWCTSCSGNTDALPVSANKLKPILADAYIILVEMWDLDEKPQPGASGSSMFHNMVMIQQKGKLVCIPFDQQAGEWARQVPLRMLFTEDIKSIHVTEYNFPFKPLLWFHAAVTLNKSIVNSLLVDSTGDIGGTAFFEMHLIDALVAMSDPTEQVVAFAEERLAFAHKHMSKYTPLH